MPLLDKITKATQDMVRGTKELSDVSRQNSLIAEEQRQIAGLYAQIGKLYCETGQSNPETPLGELCLAVAAANERITQYNDTILQIKGLKRCLVCGAENPLTSAFCGACGTKYEVIEEKTPEVVSDQKFCQGCGAEIEDEIAFCTSCGQKQE